MTQDAQSHRHTLTVTAHDSALVEQKVTEAERKAGVEIVPVLAGASGRYDRAEDLAGLWLGILFLIVAWLLFHAAHVYPWQALAKLELGIYIAVVVAGFIIGAQLSARLPALRRPFTFKTEMHAATGRRARALFYDYRVYRQQQKPVVIVYYSLYERMGAVLASREVMNAIGSGPLEKLSDELVAGNETPTALIAHAIESVGDLLAEKMPATDQENAIANKLLIID